MMAKKTFWPLYRNGLHGEEKFGAESDGGDGSRQSRARLSSRAIGPIDPAQLITLRARLSKHQRICLLVPAHLPLPLSIHSSLLQPCSRISGHTLVAIL